MLNILKSIPNEVGSKIINYSFAQQFRLYFPTKRFVTETNTFYDNYDRPEFFVYLTGTVLPGISLETTKLKWMGANVELPSDILNLSTWSTTFIVDDNIYNWMYFFDWMNWMNNNKDIYSQDFPDYCVDGRLKILNNWKKTIASFRLVNIYPKDLGDLTFNFNSNSLNTSQVTFALDRMEIDSRPK